MKISDVSWATCPKCKTLINCFDYYPSSLLMNPSAHPVVFECPNCDATFALTAKVTIEFEVSELDPSSPW